MVPPGNGSDATTVQVLLLPWVIEGGPLIVPDGPVLVNIFSPLGVPTPVGPSKPASASQARSPTLTTPLLVDAQATRPQPGEFGWAHPPAPAPAPQPLPPVV